MDIEERIVEFVRNKGVVNVYTIAKEFGLAYGTAQWWVGKLARQGKVKMIKIGGQRYVVPPHVGVEVVLIDDIVKELEKFKGKRIWEVGDVKLRRLLRELAKALSVVE